MKIDEQQTEAPLEIIDEDEFYPHSDGKPLCESNAHFWSIVALTDNIWDIVRSRETEVSVHTDMFWYWEKGNRRACRAPDLMVIFGVPYVYRRLSYLSWNHDNIMPALIIETASNEQQSMLLGELRDDYERQGVREYYVFDWSGQHMDEPLIGFRLRAGQYERIPENADGTIYSAELKMNMRAEGDILRFVHPATGEILLTRDEREAAQKKALFEQERALVEQERALVKQERALLKQERALLEQEQALVEQARAIGEKNRALSTKDQALDEQKKVLAEKDAELEQLRQLLKRAGIDTNKLSP